MRGSTPASSLNPTEKIYPPFTVTSPHVFDALNLELKDCGRTLMEIDAELLRLDSLLHAIQPNHSGRITLRWLKDGTLVRPYPVQWNYTKKTGKTLWYYKRVRVTQLVKSAKRSGEFFDIHKQLREILWYVALLLDMRKGVNLRLVTCLRTLSNYRVGNVHTLANSRSFSEEMIMAITAASDFSPIVEDDAPGPEVDDD